MYLNIHFLASHIRATTGTFSKKDKQDANTLRKNELALSSFFGKKKSNKSMALGSNPTITVPANTLIDLTKQKRRSCVGAFKDYKSKEAIITAYKRNFCLGPWQSINLID